MLNSEELRKLIAGIRQGLEFRVHWSPSGPHAIQIDCLYQGMEETKSTVLVSMHEPDDVIAREFEAVIKKLAYL